MNYERIYPLILMSKQKTKENIDKCLTVTEEINRVLKQVYQNVELTKLDATNKFNYYKEPNVTLCNLLEFYDLYMTCSQKFEEVKIYVVEAFNDNINICDIEKLYKYNLLDKTRLLYKLCDDLSAYDTINISKSLQKTIASFRDKVVESITVVYFACLYDKKHSASDLSNISKFLLDVTDKKVFLKTYSEAIYKKTTFDKTQSSRNDTLSDKTRHDKDSILEKMHNLDSFMLDLNNYNKEVLGPQYGNNCNTGLNKLLIISVKRVLTNVLLVVEKKESIIDIPFLIKLNDNLKHNDQKYVKEVEELYVFKNEINKMICNIFLLHMEKCGKMNAPNEFCDVEKVVIDLKKVFKCMDTHKAVTKVFIRTYGPFFKVQEFSDFCNKLSRQLIDRVLKMADKLPDLKKSIYLVNNLYILKDFLDMKDMNVSIQDNVNLITTLFHDELEARDESNLSLFIDSNLESLSTYFLPDEIRNQVVPKIKKDVWEGISTKGYNGNQNTLNDRINEIFKGK